MVPITGTPGHGALYPGLAAGSGGLRKPSWALLDQIRTIDKRRVRKVFGTISADELVGVDDGLALLLGLRGNTAPPAAGRGAAISDRR